MLDKATVRAIAASYSEEVRKIFDPDAIILFGSYVNGNPHEWSDIDIAIIINDYKGDRLEAASTLCGLSWEISLDIEPHLLDETRDSSGFVKYVIETGEVIFKAA